MNLFRFLFKSLGITISIVLFCLMLVLDTQAGGITLPDIKYTDISQDIIIAKPKIIEFSNSEDRPFITGLVTENTEVLIYINDELVGLANINKEGTGTDNFYYRHNEMLMPGVYKVSVVAKDVESMDISESVELRCEVSALPAPTLIKPSKDDAIGHVKPFVLGLTKNDTFVHIFIDGVYNGKTAIISHESGTASFAYRPFLNLNKGYHKVYAIAESENGKKSGMSNLLEFNIENPMPAPTIFQSVAVSDAEYDLPIVKGLAKNDSKIRVYIDKILDGEFIVKNNESGTANFAYKPSKPLTDGNHLVYTTATDSRGKESSWSNIVYFTVKNPQITDVAESEQVTDVQDQIIDTINIDEVKNVKDEIIIDIDEESDKDTINEDIIKDLTTTTNKTLEEILGETQDEDKFEEEKDSKFKLNLFIFIAFLLGVIAWIFWVNKELAKEKQSQDDDDDDLNSGNMNNIE